MDHTQSFTELLAQLTREERKELYNTLHKEDFSEVNHERLTPSMPQARELEILRVQYNYQVKMAERQLLVCDKSEVDECIGNLGRAQGATEVLSYLLDLYNTHQPIEGTKP